MTSFRTHAYHILNAAKSYWASLLNSIQNKHAISKWNKDLPSIIEPADRERLPFLSKEVLARCRHQVTIESRKYEYVFYPGHTSKLIIHFSAFLVNGATAVSTKSIFVATFIA